MIKEESKKWSKERLREELLKIIEGWNDWDDFVKKELGAETYNDLVNGYAMQKATDWMRLVGMNEEEIKEFRERNGFIEKTKS